ncbi:bifunctional helix-turn-helix transcriptional regulator/GNAT family N-acetyltransferase [Cupriavidus plantarum]|uniref:bifunctional helix-turn-helix transcriptional regulator/GNAT family N-acetyltransferase n=1 Tax=Cupriavidus plantarum TaxID=942865 RepID=UPI0015C9687E|nr:helix-turn-helix domain-containing GNAT family N-acetyltransferase [Cupriavidus plantarum]NYI02082.1 DNA-binding MarR family transcriptional regulator/GNAT superfamily N-acetyltransferase [Cupriavidus plantarum]
MSPDPASVEQSRVEPTLVEQLRDVSRQMVRELGFMGGDFAGTDLSPSAVHALIEIEKGGVTARDLGPLLRLEKSSVSRMLRRLIEAGDVAEESDGRVKRLSLTDAGRHRVEAIHAFARSQVAEALKRLAPGETRAALHGMRLYTRALAGAETSHGGSPIHVVRGYCPGIMGRIAEMHARYYARESGFGQRFESVVAGGLAEFCNRLENPRNAIWTARQDGQFVGSIAIDGEDMGDDVAHLRWFIIDDDVRGAGIGKTLLDAALAFVDERGFQETHLWTFAGLRAARHLYETRGFALAEEKPGTQWGKEVWEQRFVRRRP